MYSTLVVHVSEVPRILNLLNAPKPVVKEVKAVKAVKPAAKRKRGRPPKATPVVAA